MVEEDGAIPGLFMGLPSVEEIAHDLDDIAPALDVLVAALGFKAQGRLVEASDVALMLQMITGQVGGLVEQGFD